MLAVAAGLVRHAARRGVFNTFAFSAILAGLVVDGWIPTMHVAVPLKGGRRSSHRRAELFPELPIGPDWD